MTGTPLPTKTSTPLATQTIPLLPTLTYNDSSHADNSPTQGPSAADNANLRSGPDTAYPIVGAVVASQALDIVAKNPDGTWYQLASGAWIHGGLGAMRARWQWPGDSTTAAHFNTCTNSGGSAAFAGSTAAGTAPGKRGAFMLQALRAKLSTVRE